MSLINNLSNAGIIEQQEAIELNKKIGKSGSESKAVLEILYHFFMQKVTGSSEIGNVFVSVGSAEKQDDMNCHNKKEHSKFLEILYKEGIVPETVYQKIKTIPLTADESGYFGILHLSIELMSFYRSFTIENQLAFASLLEGKSPYGSDSLLDGQKKNKLIQDIKAEKLETYLDFFRYCHGCRFVNVVGYQGKEHILLKEAVKILNQLCYNAFTIVEITSYDEDFAGEPSYHNKQTTIVVSTGAREHRYTYTFWQNENKDQSENKSNSLLENLLLLANQLLADFNATYRLTGITNYLSEALFPDSRTQYAICRFQQENRNILEFYAMQKRFLFNRPSPVFIRFPLSYLRIEYALYHIKKCGLLAHINNEQYDDILTNIYKSTYDHVANLLAIFPNMVAAVNRTVSSGQKPYDAFLLALNQISHGVLNFTEIHDGIPEDFTLESELTFKVSFRCNGEYHEVDCNLIGKEFSDNIVYYIINEIIRKKYTEYRLVQLINSKHTHDIYLFVSNPQGEYLQSMKLWETIDRF
ncbi:hypothetical protein SAMN05421820_11560 [Pedobacter steynii]|uniref:Uncharacterized protein n=1 Tax=Pedobacter steynii TaxID=430522 RepID=A0A1H0JSZ8_9SPHI|nr:hypothetical protein [Pedobacter steynii]NQX43149.1 hypothetical protein [Pedobacter steynii]SDO46592.1 hypothetical protein SAMN05421820_11560 [Pedobacter steynii]